MPKFEIEGKVYEFPQGTTPDGALEMVENLKTALNKPPPPATVDMANPVPGSNFTLIDGKLIETPEQRRAAAQTSLKLLSAEYFNAGTDAERQNLAPQVERAKLTSTAANPHRVARAVKPESVYQAMFGPTVASK